MVRSLVVCRYGSVVSYISAQQHCLDVAIRVHSGPPVEGNVYIVSALVLGWNDTAGGFYLSLSPRSLLTCRATARASTATGGPPTVTSPGRTRSRFQLRGRRG
jgi:hypothetical protein